MQAEGKYCRACGQAALAQPAGEGADGPARVVVTIGPRVEAPAPAGSRVPTRGMVVFVAIGLLLATAGLGGWWLRGLSPGPAGPEVASGTAVPVDAEATPAPPLPSATPLPVAVPTATPSGPDSAFLLGMAQARAAGLRQARFSFQRYVFQSQAVARGHLQMPDRAEYAVAGEVPAADWLVMRQKQWTRLGGQDWVRGITSVTLVNNPTTWVHLVKYAQAPHWLGPETVAGQPAYGVGFRVAPGVPAEIDPVLTNLQGEGRAYLRQSDGALLRLSYDVTFTARRGEPLPQPMRASIDLTDQDAALTEIAEPKEQPMEPTESPADTEELPPGPQNTVSPGR